MGFLYDALFPDDLSYDTRGGPGFSNAVIETAGGEIFGVARWNAPKHSYNAKYAIKTHAQIYTLKKHYMVVGGILNGFPFKDFGDYASTPTGTLHNPGDAAATTHNDQDIGTGDGTKTQFQLRKRYQFGATIKDRTIKLPKIGTVKVGKDGVNQTTGFSFSTSTGIVTFTTAPAIGVVVTAGFEFYVPVKYEVSVDRLFPATIESFDMEGMPDIPLVEINNDLASAEEFPLGGGNVISFSNNIEYSYAFGRMVVVNPLAAGLRFILPPIADLELGPMHFVLFNAGANAVAIFEQGATVQMMLLASDAWVMANVYADSLSGGTKKWVLVG